MSQARTEPIEHPSPELAVAERIFGQNWLHVCALSPPTSARVPYPRPAMV
jgi:hypothetical protein